MYSCIRPSKWKWKVSVFRVDKEKRREELCLLTNVIIWTSGGVCRNISPRWPISSEIISHQIQITGVTAFCVGNSSTCCDWLWGKMWILRKLFSWWKGEWVSKCQEPRFWEVLFEYRRSWRFNDPVCHKCGWTGGRYYSATAEALHSQDLSHSPGVYQINPPTLCGISLPCRVPFNIRLNSVPARPVWQCHSGQLFSPRYVFGPF